MASATESSDVDDDQLRDLEEKISELRTRDDNGSHFLTRDPRDRLISQLTVTRVTRDWRLLTRHDSRLLQFPVRTTKWKCSQNQTSSLPQNSLFLESCKLDHGSTGHEYWPVTHVTHSDLLTHLTRDRLTHCHLCCGLLRQNYLKGWGLLTKNWRKLHSMNGHEWTQCMYTD